MHRIWTPVIAGLLASCGGAAAANTLIIADTELSAIYERRIDDGPGEPRLVSGKITFVADEAVFASEEICFFSYGKNIFEYNFPSREITLIDTLGPNESPYRLAADTGEDRLVALVGFDGRPALKEYIRSGDNWDTIDYSDELFLNSSDRFNGDVILPSDDKIAVSISGDIYLLDQDATGTLDPVYTATSREVALAANGVDRWLVHNVDSSEAEVAVFDLNGIEVRTLDPNDESVFNRYIRSIDWESGTTPVYAAARDGMYSAGDPAASSTIYTRILSFLVDGTYSDPSRDVSDARSLSRTQAGDFLAFRQAAGTIGKVDRANGTITCTAVHQRGNGPSLGFIQDIDVSDDKIYVLSGYARPQAILEVDRASGDRKIIAVIPLDRFYTHFGRRANGSFLMHREGTGLAPAGIYIQQRPFYIDSLTVTSDPNSPLISEVQASAAHTGFADFDIDSQGDAVAFIHPGYLSPFWRNRDGNFQATPDNSITISGSVQLIRSDLQRYQMTFTVPDTAAYRDAVDWKLRFLNRDELAGSIGYEVQFISPAGEFASPVRDYRMADTNGAVVSLDGVSTKTGEWTLVVDYRYFPNTYDIELYINPRTAPRVTAFVADEADSFLVTERHPATIGRFSLTDATVERVPIVPAPGSQLDTDPLNRIYSLAKDEPSGSAFAGTINDDGVYRINFTTGEADLFVPGRPGIIDEEAIGAATRFHYELEIGDNVIYTEDTRDSWLAY